jgi:hypothetical protein
MRPTILTDMMYWEAAVGAVLLFLGERSGDTAGHVYRISSSQVNENYGLLEAHLR